MHIHQCAAAVMPRDTYYPFHKGDETPNLVLDIDDVRPRHTRDLDINAKYPDRERYTLQWLDSASLKLLVRVPNNSDATFRKYTRIPKPSPMLLHYNYGAAAVKWGANHASAERPHASIQKRARGITGGSGSGPRESKAARDEEVMDPDEIVMFFGLEISPQSSVENAKQRIKNAKRTSMLPAWNRGERV
ncbi:hypothetical protein C8R44DRAFT_990962 [Mycena epipterygia]|nr:hypothetical protein C8R44DRAFT_990962 [Mycena epipterygia]